MKKTNKLGVTSLAMMAIFLLATVSCSKEEVTSAVTGNNLSWYSFRQQYLEKVQTFNPNASSAFTINGAQGTVINFPAGAFVDFYDPTKIITGNIQLTLQEVNSRKDLVLNGHMVGSTGSAQMVVGGELEDIMASQNGNAVKVNPALAVGSIAVQLPSSTNAGAGLSAWYKDNNFNWVNGGAAAGNGIYNFSLEKKLQFGMLSADYSCAKQDMIANAQVTVKITYEDGSYNPDPPVNDQVTIVKLIYKDAPSAVSFDGFNYNTESVSGPVTAGRDATIVVYSGGPAGGLISSTPLYFAALNVNLQAGQTYNLYLKKTDQANLDLVLNNL